MRHHSTIDKRKLNAFLVFPTFIMMVLIVIAPIAIGFYSSLFFNEIMSLRAYEVFFTKGQYYIALRNSIVVGISSTLMSVILTFPACSYFASSSIRQRKAFVSALGLCFIVSALIKTLSWSILLSRGGPINFLLLQSGLLSTPADLLYSMPATIIGTTQIVAPMTAAVIFSGMRKVDPDIMFATRSLGAGPLRAFKSAFLPQIRQSLAYAGVLTFVISAGIYVTPSLLGGPTNAMLGQIMKADIVNDYENGVALASAAGCILLATLVLFSLVFLALAGSPYHVRRRN